MIDARTETKAREKAWGIVKVLIADAKFPASATVAFEDDWDMEVYVNSSTKYEAYLYAVQDHPFRKGEKFTNTEIEVKVL